MEVEGGRDFADGGVEDGGGADMDDRSNSRKQDDHSGALAEKLLQGWTLLNEHCPQCFTPLVRNRQKRTYCAACRQWILTEAEAAARALQQQQRAERSDGPGEAIRGAGHEQAAAAAAGSPNALAHHAKSNGVGHLRLSLATLRPDEDKAPDGRNPKRFASSDHAPDSVPRLAHPEEKENGVAHRPGAAATAFQRDGPHSASAQAPPPKPALILQPAVHPVNDILVARRTLTTLNEKLEGIRQLISNSQDVSELRQLFAVLEECIHAIEVTRQLLKSVE